MGARQCARADSTRALPSDNVLYKQSGELFEQAMSQASASDDWRKAVT